MIIQLKFRRRTERNRSEKILQEREAETSQYYSRLVQLAISFFPRKRLSEELKKDAPKNSVFITEESGWMTAMGFRKYLEMFVVRVNPTKKDPALLIVDGHTSHKDLLAVLYAKENNVHIISLPPHTTHRLKPLDRAIIKPFKAAYNEACSLWLKKYAPLKISLKDIDSLVNIAFIAFPE